MKPVHRNRRLGIIAFGGVALTISAILTFSALEENVAFFYSPMQIANGDADITRRLRLGGLVAQGSVQRKTGIETHFDVTDGIGTITVRYKGLLPDLFREGQGVIAHGVVSPDGSFDADTILAKHDENYKPKELQEALADAEQHKTQKQPDY